MVGRRREMRKKRRRQKGTKSPQKARLLVREAQRPPSTSQEWRKALVVHHRIKKAIEAAERLPNPSPRDS
jgi:hypothetical protein